MPSKYDTNPLDPDFPEKVKAAQTQVLDPSRAEPMSEGAATQHFGVRGSVTEEQTRRFEQPDVSAYQQPYDGAYIPAAYQPAQFAATDPKKRKVEKIGLPENIAVALPYLPWYLGLIAGLIFLFLLPRSESKVRFHAAQGLAAHVAILIVSSALGLVGNFTNVAHAGNMIFLSISTVLLIICAIKAWRGRPIHLESIEDMTNWLDEKINSEMFGHRSGGK